MRIQGLKSRTDMDVMGRAIVTISDVAAQQMLMLDPTEKTVRRMPPVSSTQPNSAANSGGAFTMPKMEVAVAPTGQTKQMGGQSCAEFHIVMTIDMTQVGGALTAPDTRDALKDMRMVMKGSTWLSTSSDGASEFIKFQQAARAAGIAIPTGLFGGQNADPIAQAVGRTEGIPCLTEIELDYEGTGPMIEMLKKMGTMKVTSRLTEISLAPIAADMFVVPADYKETPFENPLIPRP
jgi:hypothetical protein